MTDTYQAITDRIIARLEKGEIPWKKPWAGGAAGWPKNLSTGKPYNGINVLLLGLGNGFDSPYWLTFKQAKKLGGHVKRGSKGTRIVYWNFIKREYENKNGEKKEKSIPFLKEYTVFNVEQCAGLGKHLPKTKKKGEERKFNPIDECENIVKGFKGSPEVFDDGGGQAYYRPLTDTVHLPKKERFEGDEEFYSTLFHELVHSTGHKKRLDREGIGNFSGFGSETYSEEELVAEFGAAFLCGEGGIVPKTEENSAAYIKGWLKRLRSDKKIAVLAAGKAGKAADHILGRAKPEKKKVVANGTPKKKKTAKKKKEKK